MTQPERPDPALKGMSAEEEESRNATPEESEYSRPDEKEPCLENVIPSEDVFIGEGIKTVKSDIGLLIVHKNDEKLNDVGEEDSKSKCDNGSEAEDSAPPALPPRPPPRPRQPCVCTCGLNGGELQERPGRRVPRSCWASGLRKYVFLCTACGSLSILLGALFLTVYFMLKSYTSSLNHFETIPTYVPSGMLIATGFFIICLACRKNRNSFLMKLCGLCSLCCAVLCVSVTVTTTVIHMNRLQTLRECLYTHKTQSCTCYSVLIDNDRISDEGIKFVFNSTPDCEVIHGALYSCLRAIFGLSVIGILVCIFSCMLVYQLLSHEKKKMYWAQLEMRCRYLYRQQRNPHYYSCCDECRYPPHPHELFPWELMGNRFWSAGRIGNLYTPNPENRGNHNRLRSGWNWRRLPWSRSGGSSNDPTRANLGSPDSQYGFSRTPTVDGAPYTVLDPRISSGIPTCHTGIPSTADITEGGFYSWGPPPPYASNRNSANNSPARRSLGEILHQVSPIRRNDNVSPASALHHVHRHHMHHARQCGSSSRQGTNNVYNQPDSLHKTPTRNVPITNAIQQQQAEMDALWSNSLSSVHRFQKVIQNKDNYENMYESENLPPSSGFNTLPSLKKRNQTRISDIFQNDSSSAPYFFSSAENLGCSTSNIESESHGQSKNFPPRVFLTGGQPNSSTYSLANSSTSQQYTSKSQTDLDVSENRNQQLVTDEGGSKSMPLRMTDHNTSLVRKLFVNYSPTKSKQPRSSQEPQIYSVDKKDSLLQTPKKKVTKKLGLPKDFGVEATSDGITFHYRVGIPRSPNIQNFSQFVEKSPASVKRPESGKEESSSEGWSNDKGSDLSQEIRKVPKGMKYMTKDVELLQKHNSLIKEFNKNIDLQKKYRNNKNENRKTGGIENEAFQPADESSREIRAQFPRSFHADLRYSPGGYSHSSQEVRPSKVSCSTNESESNEDYLSGNVKSNENESDTYFGDISNSSCYMSLQNDGPESLLYEESLEEQNIMPKYLTGGHSLLNKQNLKMIEDGNVEYNEIVTHSDSKQHPENFAYNRHQNMDGFQQNFKYRNSRPNNQYRCTGEQNSEGTKEFTCSRPSKQEGKPVEGKSQRRQLIGGSHCNQPVDSKEKYFGSVSLSDQYLQSQHHESTNSNDEQSSSSLTIDSGISSGRSFMAKCLESYQERSKENESNRNAEERTDSFSENVPSFTNKIPGLDNLGDFSHPLFQKPKVLPRVNRYKETETRQRKKIDPHELKFGKELEIDNQNKRNRNFGSVSKLKNVETSGEISSPLLNTCNLTLTADSNQFLEEVGQKFENSSKSQDSCQKEKFEEPTRKSPKPLPRTSVLNKNLGEGVLSDQNYGKSPRYSQNKDKVSHFLAPDAQYEYQENFKSEAKQKPQQKLNAVHLARSKPAVPARPLNLQMEHKKSRKMESLDIQMIRSENESVCPVPRRRQNGLEEPDDKNGIEIGTHSVNV